MPNTKSAAKKPSKVPAPRMSLQDTMKALEKAGSAQTRKTYARHGAPEPMFVPVVDPLLDDRIRDTVPPPPLRKRPVVLLACLFAVAVLGTGLTVCTFVVDRSRRTTAMSRSSHRRESRPADAAAAPGAARY